MHEEIERTLRSDPQMDRLVETHGRLTIEPADSEFRQLCRSIINQQLSTASANAIRERTFGLLDDEVTPERVLTADTEALRDAGLSQTKVDYLRSAAEAFQSRDLTREGLADLTDDEVVDEMTAIRGVGDWTARMYLIFVLGREDVLPLGDLAIRKGIESVYGNGAEMSRDEMREVAETWRPYRSYGTRYIWAEYEG
ncbi:DNA-3-methyladenine glycosylase family protein [Haloparvum sp. AD34]